MDELEKIITKALEMVRIELVKKQEDSPLCDIPWCIPDEVIRLIAPELAKQIRQSYIKKGEPPILSDETIFARWGAHPTTGLVSVYSSIAAAQRNTDKKWYEGIVGQS
jgi:hypothetical protein